MLLRCGRTVSPGTRSPIVSELGGVPFVEPFNRFPRMLRRNLPFLLSNLVVLSGRSSGHQPSQIDFLLGSQASTTRPRFRDFLVPVQVVASDVRSLSAFSSSTIRLR